MNNYRFGNKLSLPVLAFCSFLVGFDSIVTIPLIPAIVQDVNIPAGLGGLFVTAYAIAYAISAPIFGFISDKWGRKKVLFMGIILFSIATAFTGIAHSALLFIYFRVLSGIGAGMIEPVVYAIVGDNYSYDERGRAIGIVTGALISASIIGVPIGGYISEWMSWQWTFWFIAFLSLLTIFATLLFIPKDSVQSKEINDQPMNGLTQMFSKIFMKPSVLFALLATLLYFGGLQGMFVNVGVFYHLNYNLTSGQTGLILMVAGVGSVIGSIVGGVLADKFSKKKVILYSSLAVAFSVFLFSVMTENFMMAFMINVIWATIYGLGQTGLTSFISELNPDVRGTIIALNSSARYAGSGLFTAIAATLLYHGGFLWIGILCGVANIIVLFTAFVLK